MQTMAPERKEAFSYRTSIGGDAVVNPSELIVVYPGHGAFPLSPDLRAMPVMEAVKWIQSAI